MLLALASSIVKTPAPLCCDDVFVSETARDDDAQLGVAILASFPLLGFRLEGSWKSGTLLNESLT